MHYKTSKIGLIFSLSLLCITANAEQNHGVQPKRTYLTHHAEKQLTRPGYKWNSDWDRYIKDVLSESMLSNNVPSDVEQVCPRFFQLNRDDKKTFWAYFFQALAKPESGFNPRSRFLEANGTWSEGLMQVSYSDANRYGCGFSRQKRNIHDPKLNLQCAVKILDYQMFRKANANDRLIFSNTSYWSALRTKKIKPDGRGKKTLRTHKRKILFEFNPDYYWLFKQKKGKSHPYPNAKPRPDFCWPEL